MPINPLRRLPSVSELLESAPLKDLVRKVSHNVVVAKVRTVLEDVRAEVQSAAADFKLPAVSELAERIAERIQKSDAPVLRPVINATGVLLHTGLGRAPLAEEALAAMQAIGRDYASVELDLPTGRRSQRMAAVEGLLCELTGAESALVVNNCAGATLFTLAALAAGREVVVSRGELIEIGGSYRLPDVMAASGAVLREVGTTNKTRLDDYANACKENTAAFMLVHPSNYLVQGFAENVDLADLVRLGRGKHVPVIHDIGSGALVDFAEFGLPGEPMPANSIKAGADVVLFSGDKLLGGPQCGIVLARRTLAERMLKHPLARALRVDKLTLAALAATLRLYRDPAIAKNNIPILQLLGTSIDNLKLRAERLALQLAAASSVAKAEPIASHTFLGGGSIPTQRIPTWCVAITPKSDGIDKFATKLRQGTPAVVGRVHQDRLLLDLRSVFARQDAELASAVAGIEAG